jgi:hypothetical protein
MILYSLKDGIVDGRLPEVRPLIGELAAFFEGLNDDGLIYIRDSTGVC